MISDLALWVECDDCKERVYFDASLVFANDKWKADERFSGWEIDWKGTQGDVRCPDCVVDLFAKTD